MALGRREIIGLCLPLRQIIILDGRAAAEREAEKRFQVASWHEFINRMNDCSRIWNLLADQMNRGMRPSVKLCREYSKAVRKLEKSSQWPTEKEP